MASNYDEALAIIANIQGLIQGSTSQTSTNIKKETIRQQWPSLMLLYNRHCDAADEVAEEYDKSEERFAKTAKEANNSRNRLAEKRRARRTHRGHMDLLSCQVTALRQEYLHDPVTEEDVVRQFDRIALIHDLTLANIDLVEMDSAYEKGKQNTETWAARVKLADEERHNLRAQSKDDEVFDLEDTIRALQPKIKAWLEAMGFEKTPEPSLQADDSSENIPIMPTKYIAFGRAPTPPETLERRLRIHSTAENNPVIPRMADMISNLNRGHTIASIIQQQLNKRSLQPLSVIFANFDALQDIVTNGVNFYEKVQATFHQCEERCKVLEKQGEEFRQLVNTREIVYIAHVASLKVSMRNLDQENHQGEIERLKYDIDNAKGEIGAADNNERSLQRYALLRQASEASKKLNKICYEWENFEKNEAKWRLDYAVTVEGSHKCYEEMGRLREKLGTLHAHGLALLERVQPLRKCTCGEDCAVENYEHRYGRKDEWKMGIEGL